MSSERQFDSHYLEQEPGAWNTSGSLPGASSQGVWDRSLEEAGGYSSVALQEEGGGRRRLRLGTVPEDVHDTSMESGESSTQHSASGAEHSLSR